MVMLVTGESGWFQDGKVSPRMNAGWLHDGKNGFWMVLGWLQDGSRIIPGWL